MLHVSPVKNEKSILQHGLVGQEPLLGDVFAEELQDRDKGLVFGLAEGSDKQDRYLQDSAYWKLWGDPRNEFLKEMDWGLYNKYLEQGVSIFDHIRTEVCNFSVFEVELSDEKYFYRHHLQFPEMQTYWMDMDVRYEHFTKPLIVVNDSIDASNVCCIGSISVEIGKRGTVETSLSYHRWKGASG